MLTNREVILAKIESVYNTDPTPATTDAILVENPSWSLAGLRMVDRNNVKASTATDQKIYGGTLRGISFDVEIKGSGTAGTAPEIGTLLRACGLDETIVASTSVTYAPISTGFESITIYYYQDGILNKITGCRGNASFNLECGNKGMVSFTFTGHDGGTTDVSMVTPSYDSTVPPVFINAPFSIGAYSAVIAGLTFDMANTVATPPDVSATDGYSQIYLTKRDVNGTFSPEMTLVATNDWIGQLKAGTTMALDTGAIGATAGNIYQVTMPAVYYREMSPGDRDGVRTLENTFGAAESSGDDEFSIAFT